MTERTINQHQCFMTQTEMLSAAAMHARLMAAVIDTRLYADSPPLDFGTLEETAFRILQIVQAVKNAAIAESQLAETQRQEAAGVPNFGGELQMTCELTVGHSDGTTS